MYSNGYRYQYLAFRATSFDPVDTAGSTACGIITNYDTVLEPIIDGDGIDTGRTQSVTQDPRFITFAYNGNAVVPQGPPNNVPTNALLPPAKEDRVPTKIGC